MDVEGSPNYKNNALDHVFGHSTCSSGLQMLARPKLLVLTGKKLAFELSGYTFEYRPLPSTSTSFLLVNKKGGNL